MVASDPLSPESATMFAQASHDDIKGLEATWMCAAVASYTSAPVP
jgi:hypothetical protein